MNLVRSTVSTALLLALTGGAVAQNDREQALERRIAELERLVHTLLVERESPAAPAPAAAAPQPAQVSAANANTRFSYGGFVKSDFIYSKYTAGDLPAGNLGRDFYLPQLIPVGGESASAHFDAHAKQSRIWFGTDTTLDSGDRISSRFELDFAVPVGGDERQTNTYNPVLRRAYVSFNNWLAGQEWSLFQDLGALPETTDFIGPTEGTVFVRQAQIRYSTGPWAFSLENPETTVTPFGGGARIVTDDNTVPDLIGRYSHRGDFGYVTVAGLVRQLRIENPGLEDSRLGFGLSLAGKFDLGRHDLRWMLNRGTGVGRYLGLNIAEDAVIDADGDLDAIDVTSGFVAYRHQWSSGWRSNFIVSAMEVDNPAAVGGGANESIRSARINLFYTVLPRVDVGVEFSHARRELENGLSGNMNRVHTMVRYSF